MINIKQKTIKQILAVWNVVFKCEATGVPQSIVASAYDASQSSARSM